MTASCFDLAQGNEELRAAKLANRSLPKNRIDERKQPSGLSNRCLSQTLLFPLLQPFFGDGSEIAVSVHHGVELAKLLFECRIDTIMDLPTHLEASRSCVGQRDHRPGSDRDCFLLSLKSVSQPPTSAACRGDVEVEAFTVEHLLATLTRLGVLNRRECQFHVRAFRFGAEAPREIRRNNGETLCPHYAHIAVGRVSTNPDLSERF